MSSFLDDLKILKMNEIDIVETDKQNFDVFFTYGIYNDKNKKVAEKTINDENFGKLNVKNNQDIVIEDINASFLGTDLYYVKDFSIITLSTTNTNFAIFVKNFIKKEKNFFSNLNINEDTPFFILKDSKLTKVLNDYFSRGKGKSFSQKLSNQEPEAIKIVKKIFLENVIFISKTPKISFKKNEILRKEENIIEPIKINEEEKKDIVQSIIKQQEISIFYDILYKFYSIDRLQKIVNQKAKDIKTFFSDNETEEEAKEKLEKITKLQKNLFNYFFGNIEIKDIADKKLLNVFLMTFSTKKELQFIRDLIKKIKQEDFFKKENKRLSYYLTKKLKDMNENIEINKIKESVIYYANILINREMNEIVKFIGVDIDGKIVEHINNRSFFFLGEKQNYLTINFSPQMGEYFPSFKKSIDIFLVQNEEDLRNKIKFTGNEFELLDYDFFKKENKLAGLFATKDRKKNIFILDKKNFNAEKIQKEIEKTGEDRVNFFGVEIGDRIFLYFYNKKEERSLNEKNIKLIGEKIYKECIGSVLGNILSYSEYIDKLENFYRLRNLFQQIDPSLDKFLFNNIYFLIDRKKIENMEEIYNLKTRFTDNSKFQSFFSNVKMLEKEKEENIALIEKEINKKNSYKNIIENNYSFIINDLNEKVFPDIVEYKNNNTYYSITNILENPILYQYYMSFEPVKKNILEKIKKYNLTVPNFMPKIFNFDKLSIEYKEWEKEETVSFEKNGVLNFRHKPVVFEIDSEEGLKNFAYIFTLANTTRELNEVVIEEDIDYEYSEYDYNKMSEEEKKIFKENYNKTLNMLRFINEKEQIKYVIKQVSKEYNHQKGTYGYEDVFSFYNKDLVPVEESIFADIENKNAEESVYKNILEYFKFSNIYKFYDTLEKVQLLDIKNILKKISINKNVKVKIAKSIFRFLHKSLSKEDFVLLNKITKMVERSYQEEVEPKFAFEIFLSYLKDGTTGNENIDSLIKKMFEHFVQKSDFYKELKTMTNLSEKFNEKSFCKLVLGSLLRKEIYLKLKKFQEEKNDEIINDYEDIKNKFSQILELKEHQSRESFNFAELYLGNKKKNELLFWEMRTGKTRTFLLMQLLIGNSFIQKDKRTLFFIQNKNFDDIITQGFDMFPPLVTKEINPIGNQNILKTKNTYPIMISDNIVPNLIINISNHLTNPTKATASPKEIANKIFIDFYKQIFPQISSMEIHELKKLAKIDRNIKEAIKENPFAELLVTDLSGLINIKEDRIIKNIKYSIYFALSYLKKNNFIKEDSIPAIIEKVKKSIEIIKKDVTKQKEFFSDSKIIMLSKNNISGYIGDIANELNLLSDVKKRRKLFGIHGLYSKNSINVAVTNFESILENTLKEADSIYLFDDTDEKKRTFVFKEAVKEFDKFLQGIKKDTAFENEKTKIPLPIFKVKEISSEKKNSLINFMEENLIDEYYHYYERYFFKKLNEIETYIKRYLKNKKNSIFFEKLEIPENKRIEISTIFLDFSKELKEVFNSDVLKNILNDKIAELQNDIREKEVQSEHILVSNNVTLNENSASMVYFVKDVSDDEMFNYIFEQAKTIFENLRNDLFTVLGEENKKLEQTIDYIEMSISLENLVDSLQRSYFINMVRNFYGFDKNSCNRYTPNNIVDKYATFDKYIKSDIFGERIYSIKFNLERNMKEVAKNEDTLPCYIIGGIKMNLKDNRIEDFEEILLMKKFFKVDKNEIKEEFSWIVPSKFSIYSVAGNKISADILESYAFNKREKKFEKFNFPIFIENPRLSASILYDLNKELIGSIATDEIHKNSNKNSLGHKLLKEIVSSNKELAFIGGSGTPFKDPYSFEGQSNLYSKNEDVKNFTKLIKTYCSSKIFKDKDISDIYKEFFIKNRIEELKAFIKSSYGKKTLELIKYGVETSSANFIYGGNQEIKNYFTDKKKKATKLLEEKGSFSELVLEEGSDIPERHDREIDLDKFIFYLNEKSDLFVKFFNIFFEELQSKTRLFKEFDKVLFYKNYEDIMSFLMNTLREAIVSDKYTILSPGFTNPFGLSTFFGKLTDSNISIKRTNDKNEYRILDLEKNLRKGDKYEVNEMNSENINEVLYVGEAYNYVRNVFKLGKLKKFNIELFNFVVDKLKDEHKKIGLNIREYNFIFEKINKMDKTSIREIFQEYINGKKCVFRDSNIEKKVEGRTIVFEQKDFFELVLNIVDEFFEQIKDIEEKIKDIIESTNQEEKVEEIKIVVNIESEKFREYLKRTTLDFFVNIDEIAQIINIISSDSHYNFEKKFIYSSKEKQTKEMTCLLFENKVINERSFEEKEENILLHMEKGRIGANVLDKENKLKFVPISYIVKFDFDFKNYMYNAYLNSLHGEERKFEREHFLSVLEDKGIVQNFVFEHNLLNDNNFELFEGLGNSLTIFDVVYREMIENKQNMRIMTTRQALNQNALNIALLAGALRENKEKPLYVIFNATSEQQREFLKRFDLEKLKNKYNIHLISATPDNIFLIFEKYKDKHMMVIGNYISLSEGYDMSFIDKGIFYGFPSNVNGFIQSVARQIGHNKYISEFYLFNNGNNGRYSFTMKNFIENSNFIKGKMKEVYKSILNDFLSYSKEKIELGVSRKDFFNPQIPYVFKTSPHIFVKIKKSRLVSSNEKLKEHLDSYEGFMSGKFKDVKWRFDDISQWKNFKFEIENTFSFIKKTNVDEIPVDIFKKIKKENNEDFINFEIDEKSNIAKMKK